MKKVSFDDLHNKVCVITGGSGILGSVIARGLAGYGVKLVLIARSQKKVKIIAEEINKIYKTKCVGISADVVEKKSLENAKKIILDEFGRIDFLVNCAGGNSPDATTKEEYIKDESLNFIDNTFFGLDIGGIKNVFDLNFIGTILPTMIFSKQMVEKRRGVILNISSMAAYHPLTKIPAYSAAKSSINNFTEWLAVHFAKVNIRVNAIAPGFFLTNQNRFLLIDEKSNKLTERGLKIINNTPMGKFGEPDDLQGAVLYLLSDMSKFVTGTVLPIDGGFNAYSGV